MKWRSIKNIAIITLVLSTVLYSCASRKNKRGPKELKSPAVEVVTEESGMVKADTPEITEPVEEKAAPIEKPVVEEKKPVIEVPLRVDLPEVSREFRAAWIATVANINWPTKGNFSSEAQKREAIQLLDLLKENNFNAVIFQVRPSADALYDSPY